MTFPPRVRQPLVTLLLSILIWKNRDNAVFEKEEEEGGKEERGKDWRTGLDQLDGPWKDPWVIISSFRFFFSFFLCLR